MTVAPAGSIAGAPLNVSVTVPFETVNGATSVAWRVPPRLSVKPVAVTGPTTDRGAAGQVASGGPPLAVWRTLATHVPVQLTISTGGTSTPADAPAKVSVKPALPAPADVTVPAKPGIALIAAATLRC